MWVEERKIVEPFAVASAFRVVLPIGLVFQLADGALLELDFRSSFEIFSRWISIQACASRVRIARVVGTFPGPEDSAPNTGSTEQNGTHSHGERDEPPPKRDSNRCVVRRTMTLLPG